MSDSKDVSIKQNDVSEAYFQCKANLDKEYPDLDSGFKLKLCKIFTDPHIIERLVKEKPYLSPSNIQIYPNKFMNLVDGTMIGLGQYAETNGKERILYEKMLYEQIEPLLDEILNNQ